MFARVVNSFCFWLLTGLACLFFGCAILVPLVLQDRRAAVTEREMQTAVDRLDRIVQSKENEVALLKRRDPLIVQKIAQQLLNYRIEGGRDVPVRLTPIVEPAPADEGFTTDDMALVNRASLRLPRPEAETLARLEQPQARNILLFMAAVSIGMAIIFFGALPGQPERRDEIIVS